MTVWQDLTSETMFWLGWWEDTKAGSVCKVLCTRLGEGWDVCCGGPEESGDSEVFSLQGGQAPVAFY